MSLRLGAAAANELLAALATLHRGGPGGLRACRPLFADLLGWPAGAVGTCVALERQFPGWLVWHCPASMAWPDSWAAVRETGGQVPVSAITPAELRDAILTEAAESR
ncbi:hypothetical protein [Actinoplanes sp. L3-i22]|uniref:hypothetical protein n=1 Tax=Actinoplanes sp. L3-i22 TaxID=2836373 RepID=UPI001C74C411|nr:hypothetical protein [Actinoplanes sp. L3-i22]BCY08933.1 hypothetical protein L3i22_040210 [Actinoplanes sp. L3-i22]